MSKFETDMTSAVIFLFICFYIAGGWERIDCALGTQAACVTITNWNQD